MNKIIKAVSELKEDEVLELVNDEMKLGTDPLTIFAWLKEGMNKIGELYEANEYYISDLIMAGIIFREVIELVKITPKEMENNGNKLGTILLGTVQGDLHDIGKDIFSGLVQVAGFEVYDLGVDVLPEMFVQKAKEIKPDIIALSGVLTLSLNSMKEVVDRLEEEGMRESIKIIIGGNYISPEVCRFIGVDKATKDATEGVEACKKWVKKEK